ncbi:MAG: hypothetical protein BWY12_00517 [candidate division BRC1 bacterium ADurb.Bin183]|nr:MAG: hypothetical protein BWY12_00517 [candidate division BRC1 bacterium ADurb.Bin183]
MPFFYCIARIISFSIKIEWVQIRIFGLTISPKFQPAIDPNSLFAIRYSLFAIRYSLFAIRYSSFVQNPEPVEGRFAIHISMHNY